jgi:hypothetical protein
MNGMADDSLALSVAEATMQEWMAAVAQASLGIPPLAAELRALPTFAPHPVPARAIVRRTAPRPVRVTPPVEAGPIAGARSIYWIGLAAALAWAVLL